MSTPTPKNRNEAILSGADIEPVNRLEYFLKEAASGGAIPAPTEDDAGKVPVANNDGTASWQTPSGGGGVLVVKATGACTLSSGTWSVGVDKTAAEIEAAALTATLAIYAPEFTEESPYYSNDAFTPLTVTAISSSGVVASDMYSLYGFYKDNGSYLITYHLES